MPSWGFPNDEDNVLATRAFYARMGLICIALLGLVAPIVVYVQGPPQVDWRNFNHWF